MTIAHLSLRLRCAKNTDPFIYMYFNTIVKIIPIHILYLTFYLFIYFLSKKNTPAGVHFIMEYLMAE